MNQNVPTGSPLGEPCQWDRQCNLVHWGTHCGKLASGPLQCKLEPLGLSSGRSCGSAAEFCLFRQVALGVRRTVPLRSAPFVRSCGRSRSGKCGLARSDWVLLKLEFGRDWPLLIKFAGIFGTYSAPIFAQYIFVMYFRHLLSSWIREILQPNLKRSPPLTPENTIVVRMAAIGSKSEYTKVDFRCFICANHAVIRAILSCNEYYRVCTTLICLLDHESLMLVSISTAPVYRFGSAI
jgi:hypothetical protein